jgi:hypothetical protein
MGTVDRAIQSLEIAMAVTSSEGILPQRALAGLKCFGQ